MSDELIKKRELEECRQNCDINQKTMSEKLDELKDEVNSLGTDIKVSLAQLPQDLSDRFDGRYASKSIEKEIENLKNKSGIVLWDIMKIAIQALIALGVAYVAIMK